MIMFKKVPEGSNINIYEPYEIVDQTHQGFIYKSQITGQEVEITNNDNFEAIDIKG